MISDNKQDDQVFEKILGQALELKDSGQHISRILEMYPEHQEELKEVFLVIGALEKHKRELAPSRELLSNVLSNAPSSTQDVTEIEDIRFPYRGVIKGRPSLISLISQALKFKVAIPVAVIAVAVIFAGYRFNIINPKEENIVKQEQGQNIDDAFTALMEGLPEESAAIEEESGDAALANADFNEINELDQIYDENKF